MSGWMQRYGVLIEHAALPACVFLMLGVYLAVQSSHLHESSQSVAGKVLLTLGIFSVTLVLSNLGRTLSKSTLQE
jgi:hypothetical protein